MNYALVAGGSKGIGYAIAEALARRKYNLVLIARHSNALESAKKNLEKNFPVHVEILKYDLTLHDTADKIADWCRERKLPLKMLCNVAGLGGSKDYLKLPLEQLRYMIHLNIESYIALTFVLLPLLEKNAPSYILNVGSMAGLVPIPEKNLYAATKSAVIFFSYALHYQLKKQNIGVSCLCPGPVFTKPEIIKDTIEKLGAFGKVMAVSPESVGEVAVKKTLKRRMIIVPGLLSSAMTFIIRFLPIRLTAFVYYKLGNR